MRRNTARAPSSSPRVRRYLGDSGKKMSETATDKLGIPHRMVKRRQELKRKLGEENSKVRGMTAHAIPVNQRVKKRAFFFFKITPI